MLVAARPSVRRCLFFVGGTVLLAAGATAVASRTAADAGSGSGFFVTVRVDDDRYLPGANPIMTIEVTSVTSSPAVELADVVLAFSDDGAAPLDSTILPPFLVGQVMNSDGTLTLIGDEVTCTTPAAFIQAALIDTDTGMEIERSNVAAIVPDLGVGTDPGEIPECNFSVDVDYDGDGEPDVGDPIGGEGCSKFFWRKCCGFGSSDDDDDSGGGGGECVFPIPLATTNLFSDIFEDAFPGDDLCTVLKGGTGGQSSQLKKLGKETVSALLNNLTTGVDYDLGTVDIITLFNDVFPGTDQEYIAVRLLLEDLNTQGSEFCPDDFAAPSGRVRLK